MKMIKGQKGNMQLVVVIIVIIGILLGVLLIKQRTNILPSADAPTPNYPIAQPDKIQNSQGLVQVSDELDQADIDIIDAELNQNDADLSNF